MPSTPTAPPRRTGTSKDTPATTPNGLPPGKAGPRHASPEAHGEAPLDFERLFRSNPALVAVSTLPDRRFVDVNDTFLETLGYTWDEVVGRTPDELGLFPNPAQQLEASQGLRRDGRIRDVALQVRHKDGTVFEGLFSGHVFQSGGATLCETVMTEVTDRKHAEDDVRASEARFRGLLQGSPGVAVQGCAEDGTTLFWNRASERLYGYTAEEAVGRNVVDLIVPPERRGTVRARLAEMARTGTPAPAAERLLQRRDGARIPVFSSHAVVKVPGRAPEIFRVDVDLTELRRATDALRRSEEEYRSLFEHSREGLLVLEAPTWTFTAVNPAGVAMFGARSREELLCLAPWQLSPERQPDGKPSPAKALEMIETALRRGHHFFEWVHRRLDGGGDFPAEVFLVRVEQGGKLVLQGTVRDVSARKRTQKALAESEERYRSLFDQAVDGIAVVEAEGEALRVNAAFARMHGYESPEEMASLTLADLRTPATALLAQERRRRLLEGETTMFEAEHYRKDGSVVPLLIDGSLVSLGGKSHFLGFCRDLTAARAAQAAKEKLEAQFRHAQKLESVGRLAGGVAHDFNNMLSIIIGRTDLALRQLAPTDPARADLAEVAAAAHRSAELTNQLLAFARQQTANPRVIDLNTAISQMLKMLKRLIGEDVELVWQPGEELWGVSLDPSQLDQILANLVVNARDAIAGAGGVTVATENVSFGEAAGDRGGGEYVLLTVRDTGCGMPPEVLEQLFEPFYTTKELGKGTGLGLSTVYGIVHQNGGSVTVESQPGEGTTFRIHLPRSRLPLDDGGRDDDGAGAAGGTETLLVVEDDDAILLTVRSMLERSGYTVLPARTAEEALARFSGHEGEVHLLLTDVLLPKMNGCELARVLRHRQPGLACLYTSGYSADVIARTGLVAEG
ncbi:MAG: PAS domain S-box protein, partial [Deltaproteobacteria bacterium]|nr:PAS domain S-box protein [Deltaproteobacteria bacterium]